MSIESPPEHPSRIARIGSVLALLGSLIWVQWPIDFNKFNVAAFVLTVAALVAWISIEFAEYKVGSGFADNVLSEDVSKLNSLLKMIDRDQFYTIRRTYIQTYMDDDAYDGVTRLVSYRENDIFPFHNLRIQSLYEKFADDADSFVHDFYNLYTSDGRGRSTWRPSGGRYVSDEIYEEVMAEIAVLNDRASKLADLWEELINVALRELKGASRAIERYEL